MNAELPLYRNPPLADRGREPFRPDTAVRTVTSDELFCGSHEIAIAHRGAFYRLKITRQGKLILNK